jgi:hypothetical protein
MGKVIPKGVTLNSDDNILENFFPIQKVEKSPDDIEYNQKWWKWYCQENCLDVATGKSKDSRFLYVNPLF